MTQPEVIESRELSPFFSEYVKTVLRERESAHAKLDNAKAEADAIATQRIALMRREIGFLPDRTDVDVSFYPTPDDGVMAVATRSPHLTVVK